MIQLSDRSAKGMAPRIDASSLDSGPKVERVTLLFHRAGNKISVMLG
jgi:hypothetical protein